MDAVWREWLAQELLWFQVMQKRKRLMIFPASLGHGGVGGLLPARGICQSEEPIWNSRNHKLTQCNPVPLPAENCAGTHEGNGMNGALAQWGPWNLHVCLVLQICTKVLHINSLGHIKFCVRQWQWIKIAGNPLRCLQNTSVINLTS